MKPSVIAFILFGFALAPHAAEITGPLAGVWTWNFTMPDGSVVKPQLRLKLEGDTLTGTNSFRPGTEIAISDAKLEGDQISFQVVRERDGRQVITRYRGKVADGRITGKIESNWNGEFQTYDWEAVHQNRNLEGRWVWGGRAVELRVERGELKGKVILEGNAEFPFVKSSLTDGEVIFKIEREKDRKPYINIFRAKLQDGVLKGQIERVFDGESNFNEWEAKRTP
jgi:hypothetical protein